MSGVAAAVVAAAGSFVYHAPGHGHGVDKKEGGRKRVVGRAEPYTRFAEAAEVEAERPSPSAVTRARTEEPTP